jgi:glutamate racemase
LKAADVDTLVLGCTHYPLMSAAIQYVMGPDVRLVSSAEETAADVYGRLVSAGLERTDPSPPRHSFECTGDDKPAFLKLAHRFLGPEVSHVDTFEALGLSSPQSGRVETSIQLPTIGTP